MAVSYFGSKLTASYEEAAGRYGVSVPTIKRLVAVGAFPTVKIRGVSRIPIDALDAYYRKQLKAGEAEAAKRRAAAS